MKKSSLNNSIDLLKKIYLGGFCILIMVLFLYQIVNGDYYFERAKNNYVRLLPSRAIRGTIFDRRGEPLAYDRATFNISVIPYQIKNKKIQLFKELSAVLEYDPTVLYENYAKNLRGRFSPVNILEDVDKSTALAAKEKFENLILINPEPERFYSQAWESAHILGYVKEATSDYEMLKKYGYSPLERVGFLGIEQYYDAYLQGQDGADSVEVDAKGEVVGFLGKQIPVKGKDIYLTLDSQIQKIASESMEKKRGAIILMDSNTGEILALYSQPSFNSNSFIQGKNINRFLTNKRSPLLNRTIQAIYPLGSIFKPILATAALEAGKISPNDNFTCDGEFKLGITSFKCMHAHGSQNLSQAIYHSCNIYFYNTGLALGPDLMSKWAKKFGLDSVTDIDLPYEKKGFVPSPKWKQRKQKTNWFGGDTLNFSIGQGFLGTTPLEALRAINVFASDGYLISPHILKRVQGRPGSPSSKTYLVIKEENLKIIKKALRETVKNQSGTAHVLEKLELNISGKTGTAQAKGRPHGWFIGFFPHGNTNYSLCIFLENGGSSYAALKVGYKFLKRITADSLLDYD